MGKPLSAVNFVLWALALLAFSVSYAATWYHHGLSAAICIIATYIAVRGAKQS